MNTLNQNGYRIVDDESDRLITHLETIVTRDNEYSQMNLIINTVTVALAKLVMKAFHEQGWDVFLDKLTVQMKGTFDVNRENKG